MMIDKADDCAAAAVVSSPETTLTSSLTSVVEQACLLNNSSSQQATGRQKDDSFIEVTGCDDDATIDDWANSEVLSISSSGLSSSPAFVVFESPGHFLHLGPHRPCNNLFADSSALEEDDSWMNQLLPLQQRCPRDCGLYHRHPHHRSISEAAFDCRQRYQRYRAAYVTNLRSNSDEFVNSASIDHHLSNEEWVVLRRRRDGRLLRRYQHELDQILGGQQIVSSSLDDLNRWDQPRSSAELQRFVRRIVTDGQVLLSNDIQDESGPASHLTFGDASLRERISTDENPQRSGGGQRSASVSTLPRIRARRTAVSYQARREHLQHQASSAVQRSLDLVLMPWRIAFQNDTVVSAPTDGTVETFVQAQRSSSEDGSGTAIASESHSMSNGHSWGTSQDSTDQLPPWPSGRGWRVGQMDGSHEDEYASHSDTSSGTRYWSTGTAMETDYESSVSLSYRSSSQMMEDWENASMQFPSVEEEDPHQYEFMPTLDDPLFPDDPFAQDL